MHSSGVICELNPFHDGHARLLRHMRDAVGPDGCVICLMSGRFVQRGEVAVADPYLRARMAMAGGADLVVELPFPWSAASAEHFATAGVRMLTSLGVELLAFGSESGDASLLAGAAEAVDSPGFGERYAFLCREGRGTTAAYTDTVREMVHEIDLPPDFPSSNDLLGIAYLRAIKRVRAERETVPKAMVVRREGADYRDEILHADTLPSATALRRLIREASCDPIALSAMLSDTMPSAALSLLIGAITEEQAPLDGDFLLSFFHTYYRLQHPDALQGYSELSGGLAAHMVRCAKESASPADFFAALRTRQYTDARLRRALLFGVLGVTDQDLRAEPIYTTLLAANARGCTFLKAHARAQDEGTPPFVVTKPADAPFSRQSELNTRADALFTLCFPAPHTAGDMLRRTPYIGN